jgi:hypothetical protein
MVNAHPTRSEYPSHFITPHLAADSSTVSGMQRRRVASRNQEAKNEEPLEKESKTEEHDNLSDSPQIDLRFRYLGIWLLFHWVVLVGFGGFANGSFSLIGAIERGLWYCNVCLLASGACLTRGKWLWLSGTFWEFFPLTSLI